MSYYYILFVTANVVQKINKRYKCMFQTTAKVMSINDVNSKQSPFHFNAIACNVYN